MTPTPVQPPLPMPSETSPVPASPAVQTLDRDDDEDIAEDQPMPAQPLLPARRPRASSIADPPVAVEAQAEVVPVATPVEALTQVVLVAPAVDAPVEGAVAPAAKKARQYALEPPQPFLPQLHLQPPLHPPALPASSSSPAALPELTTTSSPMETEAKKQKQQDDEEDKDMDLFHPLEPTDPPLLPIDDQAPPAALDLEASRSRSRTHSEASETPTIAYPGQSHDPSRQIGQEASSVPAQPADPPQTASHSSSVAPTEFYSDIAKAHGRVHSQLGDSQDFMFWNTMGKHHLVLWLCYPAATSYHTLDMSMWGAVCYRQTFSSHDYNVVQSIAIDHKHPSSTYRTGMPILYRVLVRPPGS